MWIWMTSVKRKTLNVVTVSDDVWQGYSPPNNTPPHTHTHTHTTRRPECNFLSLRLKLCLLIIHSSFIVIY